MLRAVSQLWAVAHNTPLACAPHPAHTQIWERRRRIPSATYADPLDHIFTEFDADGDGHLTAAEIAAALQSRSVKATKVQVQEFIDGECGCCVAAGVWRCVGAGSCRAPTFDAAVPTPALQTRTLLSRAPLQRWMSTRTGRLSATSGPTSSSTWLWRS
jgi:hypothetical protein